MRSKGETILGGCFWAMTSAMILLWVSGRFVFPWGEMPEIVYIHGSAVVLAMLSLWLVLCGSLAYGRTSLNRWLFMGVTAIGLFLLAVIGSETLARVIRRSQVRTAIVAGLEEDCRKLLDRYPDVSVHRRRGTLSIRRGSPEFGELPPSIRNFGPGVVVVQGGHDDLPVHVALIKSGFGPEWDGLRVFREPPIVPNWLRKAEQISPRTYLCLYSE